MRRPRALAFSNHVLHALRNRPLTIWRSTRTAVLYLATTARSHRTAAFRTVASVSTITWVANRRGDRVGDTELRDRGASVRLN